MAEFPIIFSMPMVQAILKGTKTVTRRTSGIGWVNSRPDDFTNNGLTTGENDSVLAGFRGKANPLECASVVKCPYGKVGDLLWVRETFQKSGWAGREFVEPAFKADGHKTNCKGWCPSIHMPKDIARIWLKITDIGLERLQSISAQDAINEGVEQLEPWPEAPDRKRFKLYMPKKLQGVGESATFDPVMSFYTLWVSINGDQSVIQNPWVWVIRFERVERPADHVR